LRIPLIRPALLLVLLTACSRHTTPDGTDSTDTEAPSDTQTGTLTPGRYFPDAASWYQDISDAAVDPDSEALIGALQAAGWGLGRFQIDWSLEVLEADGDTPRRAFEPTDDFYTPDCDHVPMPVPGDGNLEGESGLTCTNDGDCHLLVAERDEGLLYEMWRADIQGDTFRGGCLAVWNMNLVYPPEGRGDQCTSADAAGYPIAPLLPTADEVAAGEVRHALRLVLPNESIRDGAFYHPATHATNAGGGGETAMPYGARLRLRADFDETRISDPDGRVLVAALKTYGMFLADGGSVALTFQSDQRTEAKWAELFEEDGSRVLEGIQPEDFEVLALDGPAIPLTFDCKRSGL
jgi:hypothetical protein